MPTYSPLGQASFSTTSAAYSPLLSDGERIVSRSGTVASGIGILKRGTIVKCDPATGAITLPAAAADCNGVLADDVDATAATVAALVYLSGKMKADAIIWPAALGHAVVSDALRDFGILIESVVFTDGITVKSVPTEAQAQAAQNVVEYNREGGAARGAEAPEIPPEGIDHPLAYLTPDEREKNPELADVPSGIELVGEHPPGSGTPDVPPVSISPTSNTVPASGGTGSIAVAITGEGQSGTWTVDKDADATWLSYTPTTPQSEDGGVEYTADANTGAARTAHFYINGKTFTLNQSATAAR
jgi:hypothetical protein